MDKLGYDLARRNGSMAIRAPQEDLIPLRGEQSETLGGLRVGAVVTARAMERIDLPPLLRGFVLPLQPSVERYAFRNPGSRPRNSALVHPVLAPRCHSRCETRIWRQMWHHFGGLWIHR